MDRRQGPVTVGGQSPVLALNHAIVPVEGLGLPNIVYSLQNDGVSLPTGAVLLSNAHHPTGGIEWDAVAMGLAGPNEMVAVVAIAVAKLMGCARVVMVCCDSLVNGDLRTIVEGKVLQEDGPGLTSAQCYSYAIPRVLAALEGIDHSFVTPGV